jgi:magnesium transporter
MAKKQRFKKVLPAIRHFGSTKKPGSAPGTIEHIGKRHLEEIKITVHDYDDDHLQEITIDEIQKVKPYLDDPSKTWIKVKGLHDTEKLKSIWNYFELHPLIQEDIVHTTQRPKVEIYENCIFFVLRMLNYSEEEQSIQAEQISIVLGRNYVMSFQETDQDYFKPILDRLSIENSRIRSNKTDYLTYALIDAVVDHYFNIIEHIANKIESIEDELLDGPGDQLLHKIHRLRREVIFFRKSIWPLRDAINSVIRDESKFIGDNTKIYLRDVYDHQPLKILNLLQEIPLLRSCIFYFGMRKTGVGPAQFVTVGKVEYIFRFSYLFQELINSLICFVFNFRNNVVKIISEHFFASSLTNLIKRFLFVILIKPNKESEMVFSTCFCALNIALII